MLEARRGAEGGTAVAAVGVRIDDDAGVPVAALAIPSGGVAIFLPWSMA